MTAQEFLVLSTKLFKDMKSWIAEAAKDDGLSPSDLAMLNASMKIVERVTLKEAEVKPETNN
jgi:ribosome-binding protein aMBF1 (putative translation factor)